MQNITVAALAFALFSLPCAVFSQENDLQIVNEMNDAEAVAGPLPSRGSLKPKQEPNSDAAPGELSGGNEKTTEQALPQEEAKPGNGVEAEAKPEPTEESGEHLKVQGAGNGGETVEGNKVCKCHFTAATAYVDRRATVGGFFGFMAGTYSPDNYQPNFNNQTFNGYYTDKKGPNIEMVLGMKLNFFFGSIGPQITGGYYSAQHALDGAKLTITPVTAGLIYAMDNLFNEPYVVPYVVVGEYTAIYNESVGGLSVKGNTAFAPFYAVGLMFQLDWMDAEAHASAYEDYGIENAFLYVEGRSFLPSGDNAPNLSTPLQVSGGLKVEF